MKRLESDSGHGEYSSAMADSLLLIVARALTAIFLLLLAKRYLN